MRDIKIMSFSDGYIDSIGIAPDHEIPGRYKNKDVFEIKNVPMAIPFNKVIEMFRQTIFGTTRRVIPYSEFKHNRLIVR